MCVHFDNRDAAVTHLATSGFLCHGQFWTKNGIRARINTIPGQATVMVTYWEHK
jgi:hypothetical protein